MIINGKPCTGSGQTLGAFLQEQGFDRSRVAVERNGEIVPRAQFDDVLLEEADRLEIVQFVGGG